MKGAVMIFKMVSIMALMSSLVLAGYDIAVRAQTVPIVPPIIGLSVDSCDATQVTFSASKKDCPHLRYTTKGTTATDWHITYRCSQT
jgi:hypothetical protein